MGRAFFLLLLAAAGARGFAQPTGVPADWNVVKAVSAMSEQSARLAPLLAQLTPKTWIEQGAPEAYVAQWTSVTQELSYLSRASQSLEKQPERLTLALEALFRLQSIESSIYSLADGVRKYQNPAVGDLLVGTMLENSGNRDRLRDYVSQLAEQNEVEFSVADREAQRCRADITRPAAAPAKKQ